MSSIPAHIVRGEKTRKRVLEIAVRVATVEGLESLTIGRVAEAASLTKAGLLGHFTSKEELQLATLRAAALVFMEQVVTPAQSYPPGLPQLVKLIDSWMAFVAREKGGCFFASVSAEFDCRGGPVHDAIATMIKDWIGGLRDTVVKAQKLRQIRADVDADVLVLKLYGLEMALNLRLQLLRDTKAHALTRRAMRETLFDAATSSGRKLIDGN